MSKFLERACAFTAGSATFFVGVAATGAAGIYGIGEVQQQENALNAVATLLGAALAVTAGLVTATMGLALGSQAFAKEPFTCEADNTVDETTSINIEV